MRVYVDGSVNGNDCAYCVHIGKRESERKCKRICEILDLKYSVLQMEYMALVSGLKVCDKNATILSDCMQVVNEVNLIKQNRTNKNLFNEAIRLMKLKKAKVIHIMRDKNLAGIYLEKRLFKIKKDFREVLHPKIKKKLTKKQKYLKYSKHKK